MSFLNEMEAAIECGYIFPLSAIHYMEFSRISNLGRRSRLGRVMWEYSRGRTLLSYDEIVKKEIEDALVKTIPTIKPRQIKLIGKGIAHAFGEKVKEIKLGWLNELVEEAMLTGHEALDIEPLSFNSNEHRVNFFSHLGSIHENKKKLDRKKWDSWLYAIAITDILKPLYEVLVRHDINKSVIEQFSASQFSEFVDAMPTRHLDLHLHRQVLKNPNYKAKLSDLEDWAGLGVAACYCDIVVCEKHFANMLVRDKYKTRARVETELHKIFEEIK